MLKNNKSVRGVLFNWQVEWNRLKLSGSFDDDLNGRTAWNCAFFASAFDSNDCSSIAIRSVCQWFLIELPTQVQLIWGIIRKSIDIQECKVINIRLRKEKNVQITANQTSIFSLTILFHSSIIIARSNQFSYLFNNRRRRGSEIIFIA